MTAKLPFRIPDAPPARLPKLVGWLAGALHDILRALRLPVSDRRDNVMSWLRFVASNRRVPRRQPLFNDVYFRIKTGPALKRKLAALVTDKELLKHHVTEKLGEGYNVPTFAVLRTSADIIAYDFPEQCCIKPTHASGKVIVRSNGEPVDRREIIKWISLDYYASSAESNYRPLERKIIVEQLVWHKPDLTDYKFHCINGKAKIVRIIVDRNVNRKSITYDAQWNLLPYWDDETKPGESLAKPTNFDAMVAAAERLAADFFMVRVDCYSDGKEIRIGEITNCSNSAATAFTPPQAEIMASKLMFTGVTQEQWAEFFGV